MFDVIAQMKDPGSSVGATMTLAIATVGCGVLALPVAFASAGVIVAMMCLVCVAMMTIFSCRSLAQTIMKLDLHCYEDISRELLGPSFETLVRYILIFYNLAACVGYVVIVSDLFLPLQDDIRAVFPALATSKHTMVAFWFVVMLPMSLVRNISSLRHSSLFAIGVAVYLALAIVLRFFFPFSESAAHLGGELVNSLDNISVHHVLASTTAARTTATPFYSHKHVPVGSPHGSSNNPYQTAGTAVEQFHVAWFGAWNGVATLLSIPILMFSFDCESLVFQIFNSLNERHVAKMTQVAMSSTLLVSVLYATIGTFGCLSHGTAVTDNVLHSYNPKKDPVFAAAYVLYSVPAVMAYTLTLFPVRDAIFNLLFNYSVGGHGGEGRVSDACYRMTSFGLSCVCVLVATVTPGIVSVFALLGGMCSSTLCLTYPAAFRIRLHSTGLLRAEPWERRFMYFQVIAGICGGLFGTFVGAVKAFGLAY